MKRSTVQFVNVSSTKTLPPVTLITKAFRSALENEGLPDALVRVVWISEDHDVLSFPLAAGNLLGEILVSPRYARRIAGRDQLLSENLLLRHSVHGLFHLLGYDHETPEDYAVMVQRERKTIEALGREFVGS